MNNPVAGHADHSKSGRAAHQLQLTAMGKCYQLGNATIEALRDVSLTVSAGEIATIVGPSGCGKSTLLRIVAGLEMPTAGSSTPLPKNVGYMPQEDLLLPWRSVLENITLPLRARSLNAAAARQQARQYLPQFGLADFAHLYPHRLSGGLRQRAAFLRTVVAGQRILLLDEPFGALDAQTREGLQNWLLALQRQNHWTVLFVTHDVNEAVYLGDRVLVMSDRPGSIIADIAVSLPHPRKRELTTHLPFQRLVIRVRRQLYRH